MKKRYIIFGLLIGGISISAKADISSFDKMLVKCPVGTYMTIDNYTDSCPSGEKRTLYRN